jgi:rRNA processing protein Krr1/Pno1
VDQELLLAVVVVLDQLLVQAEQVVVGLEGQALQALQELQELLIQVVVEAVGPMASLVEVLAALVVLEL